MQQNTEKHDQAMAAIRENLTPQENSDTTDLFGVFGIASLVFKFIPGSSREKVIAAALAMMITCHQTAAEETREQMRTLGL